ARGAGAFIGRRTRARRAAPDRRALRRRDGGWPGRSDGDRSRRVSADDERWRRAAADGACRLGRAAGALRPGVADGLVAGGGAATDAARTTVRELLQRAATAKKTTPSTSGRGSG